MSDPDQNGPVIGPKELNSTALPARGKRVRRVVLVVVLVLLAALGGGATGRLHRYVMGDRAFCLSCHAQVVRDIGSRGHAKLSCVTCHRSTFTTDLRLLLLAGKSKSRPHGQVDLGRCKTCHFDQNKESKTARSIGHQNHVTALTHLTCDKCHVLKKHAAPINRLSCKGCHTKVAIHEHGMTEIACLSCHQFIKEGRAGDPGATGCPTCHGGKPPPPGQPFAPTKTKPITVDVVHGNVNACRLCHEPHRPDPAYRRHGNDCASCHRKVVDQHIEANIPTHKNCAECHAVHGPRPKTPDLCVRCHAAQIPKPFDLKLAARHQGCAGCHEAHTFRPKASRCIECHAPIQATLATWKSEPHANCLNCHSGHSGNAAATACPTCHVAQRGHGHEKCTTCHEPHKDKSQAKVCANCHQPVFEAIAEAKAPQHRVCASCHATHAAPLAAMRCGGCHGKQGDLVARAPPAAHKSCKSCHLPHQFAANNKVCRNCHRPSDLGAHRDGCANCHERHGPPGRPRLVCNNCHNAIGAGRASHAECGSCHSVHRQPRGGPACVSCHRDKVGAVNIWKPAPHQKCDSCHQRHSNKVPKACAECHTNEASQPLAKGHQCLGCHNPHSTPVLNSGLCANCHKPQAASVSGASAIHANCIKCHQPHSSTRPSCQGCHQTVQGSHATNGHQQCLACHASHAVKVTGRTKCLSCHQDMQAHFPSAAQCTSCHLFK